MKAEKILFVLMYISFVIWFVIKGGGDYSDKGVVIFIAISGLWLGYKLRAEDDG